MSDTDQATEQSLEQRFQNHYAAETPESPPERTPAPQETPESAEPPAENVEATEQPQGDSEEYVELEWNGKQYQLPKELEELKQGGMREADYRRKTQEIADLRRHVEAQKEQHRLVYEFQKATQTEQEELRQLTHQIGQYKTVDWVNLDAQTAMSYQANLAQLKDRRQELERTLGQKHQEFTGAQNQKRAEMARATYDYISKHVPGFVPDSTVEKEVAGYADKSGLPTEAFVQGVLAYPSIGVLAWKAMQYDKLKEGKAQAIRAVQKAPPVVKPGSVTGNGAPSQKLKDMRSQFKKSGDWRDAADFLVAANRKG